MIVNCPNCFRPAKVPHGAGPDAALTCKGCGHQFPVPLAAASGGAPAAPAEAQSAATEPLDPAGTLSVPAPDAPAPAAAQGPILVPAPHADAAAESPAPSQGGLPAFPSWRSSEGAPVEIPTEALALLDALVDPDDPRTPIDPPAEAVFYHQLPQVGPALLVRRADPFPLPAELPFWRAQRSASTGLPTGFEPRALLLPPPEGRAEISVQTQVPAAPPLVLLDEAAAPAALTLPEGPIHRAGRDTLPLLRATFGPIEDLSLPALDEAPAVYDDDPHAPVVRMDGVPIRIPLRPPQAEVSQDPAADSSALPSESPGALPASVAATPAWRHEATTATASRSTEEPEPLVPPGRGSAWRITLGLAASLAVALGAWYLWQGGVLLGPASTPANAASPDVAAQPDPVSSEPGATPADPTASAAATDTQTVALDLPDLGEDARPGRRPPPRRPRTGNQEPASPGDEPPTPRPSPEPGPAPRPASIPAGPAPTPTPAGAQPDPRAPAALGRAAAPAPAGASPPSASPAPAAGPAGPGNPAAPAPTVLTNPEEHYRNGNTLLKERKVALAIEEYKNCLRLDPTYAKAFRGLGISYATLKKDKSAIKAYEQYLRLAPDAADAPAVRSIVEQYYRTQGGPP